VVIYKKGVTTNASEHDSKPVKELVNENDRGEDLLADSAYIGKGVKRVMRKFGMKDKVIKRNTRGKKNINKLHPLDFLHPINR
jgi:IS5 family transposase